MKAKDIFVIGFGALTATFYITTCNKAGITAERLANQSISTKDSTEATKLMQMAEKVNECANSLGFYVVSSKLKKDGKSYEQEFTPFWK